MNKKKNPYIDGFEIGDYVMDHNRSVAKINYGKVIGKTVIYMTLW